MLVLALVFKAGVSFMYLEFSSGIFCSVTRILPRRMAISQTVARSGQSGTCRAYRERSSLRRSSRARECGERACTGAIQDSEQTGRNACRGATLATVLGW